MNRRNFIKLSGVTAASLSPIVRIGGGLAVSSQLATASESFSDYKALVVIFLDGGNDSMNMIIPTRTEQHDEYKVIRNEYAVDDNGQATNSGLGIANIDLYSKLDVDENGHFQYDADNGQPYADTAQDGDGKSDEAIRSYRKGLYKTTETTNNGDGTYTNTDTETGLGINSMMPELAAMYKKGKVAIVSNVGTLIKPIVKADTENDENLPVFLFAHNHQKRAVYTAQAEKLGSIGWAGKIADAWNVNDPVGLNLTYGDVNRMLIGKSTSPLKMPTSNPVAFETINATDRGDILESLFQRFDNIAKTDAFSRYYSSRITKAGNLSTTLINGMKNKPLFEDFTAKNAYGDALFNFEKNGNGEKFTSETVGLQTHDDIREGIFQQLRAAAEMIKVGKDELAHPRQIIYIRMPGYDSHSGQAANHLINLRSLSMAMSDFQKSLEEMGLAENVLTTTLSEFGRTLQNNNDGTDHGWGGHQFMMCGDPKFNGGNVYGTVMEDLALDGTNTYTAKGRIIPTTSIEQMISPCLKWFGVSDDLMATALPNLQNFTGDNDNGNTANLAGIFES